MVLLVLQAPVVEVGCDHDVVDQLLDACVLVAVRAQVSLSIFLERNAESSTTFERQLVDGIRFSLELSQLGGVLGDFGWGWFRTPVGILVVGQEHVHLSGVRGSDGLP